MSDFDDLRNYIAVKSGQGIPEETLIKIAMISINQHFIAADRWVRLEGGDSPSAPFWIEQREADHLLGALKGQRGTTSRVLKQALEELFA